MNRLFLILPLLASGCAGEQYRSPAANPFQSARRIAVAPFLNRTADPKLDGVAQGDAFASELVAHPGFLVYRPSEVAAAAKAAGRELRTADDYLAAARDLGADAIVVAAVTELRTYYPPRVTVALQLLMTGRAELPAADLEKIIRSGRPLEISPQNAPHLNQQFEAILDADSDRVRSAVKSWAAARVDDESPWRDGEGVLRSREPYFRFACALLVERILDAEVARQDALKPKWRDQQ
ncbi:MAG: hypothetical protein HYY18_23080 [Planctomycetes bacterium]|nr:hypothetical protein [Planctomycetota bacterium]